MITMVTAIIRTPRTDCAIKSRRVDARLAPGGRERPRERTQVVGGPSAGQARWQRILDLLDPDKRCGAWSLAAFEGRPVVCTRAPHDARQEHANAETGWRWYGEES
jgi:hypothetical protein